MYKAGWTLAALLLMASAARAQVPPLLVGQWQVREISFLAGPEVPDSVREKLDDPEVGGLNVAIAQGDAQLRVTFQADGSYHFTILRAGETVRAEAGTYTVDHDRLLASSRVADGSSFHDQQLSRLTRRTLVLAFAAGPALPGVVEQIEYQRVK